jgi:hypothetical protein
MLERPRALALTNERIRRQVRFIEPIEPMLDPRILDDVEQLLAEEPAVTLVVGDAVDELLSLHGLDPNSTLECERFYRDVVERCEPTGRRSCPRSRGQEPQAAGPLRYRLAAKDRPRGGSLRL